METRSEILAKVKRILLDELHLDAVADDAKQADHPEWDSMTYMSVVARVQDEFGVQATPENIQSFASVEDILKEIGKSRGGA